MAKEGRVGRAWRKEKHVRPGSKMKTLDLNNPQDARTFILEALPEALPNRSKAKNPTQDWGVK